uniref:AAA+ ATPase domain-containing protein n=2 Tax=Clastoptera arizonana TaxID=38151 RepID=A0A1B6CZR9_9HEMI
MDISTPPTRTEMEDSLVTDMKNIMTRQEQLKKKMAKIKAARSARTARLKPIYRTVMEMVAFYFDQPYSFVEEGILDTDQHVDLLESFFSVGGCKAIVFNETKNIPPEFPRICSSRMIVTDCKEETISGVSVLVYRPSENINATEEICYSMIIVDEETKTAVGGLHLLLSLVSQPHISQTSVWGDLNKTIAGQQHKKEFLDELAGQLNFLKSTKIALDGTVSFESNPEMLDKLTTQDFLEHSTSKTTLNNVERTVRTWMKQIIRVLKHSENLRSEKPDTPPEAELDHWRKLLVQFTSIVEHNRTKECTTFISFLLQGHSKLFKKWQALDNWVTCCTYESQDNVKYLYALQKYWLPLYKMEPLDMANYLPSLMYAIRMVYATSRFLNTTEKITTLLVKVTNQMLNSCLVYLTDNNSKTIWVQKKSDAIKKMNVCLNLYNNYRQVYQDTKDKIVDAEDEANLECSQMFVFGKFKTFKNRLVKLIDVLETALKYSILSSSKLEGIEVYDAKYKNIYLTISSKSYDALNHRKFDFDIDYEIFKKAIASADEELIEYKKQLLSLAPNITVLQMMIRRFEKLNLDTLDMFDSHNEALGVYNIELNKMYDYYLKNLKTPDIPRNFPPSSGRIVWLRKISKRIQDPMDVFEVNGEVLEQDGAIKVLRKYDELQVELHYQEEILHQRWFEFASQVTTCLSVPLLIISEKSGLLVVNFHPKISEVILEAGHFWRLEKPIPEIAQIVVLSKEKIHKAYDTIKVLVKRNILIRKNVPSIFFRLFRFQLLKLDKAFQPCLNSICWTSIRIFQVMNEIKNILDDVETFCKEAVDMKETRIDEIMELMSKQMLIFLPQHAMDPQELYTKNIEYGIKVAKELYVRSRAAEDAVIELINKFVAAVDDPNINEKDKYNWLDLKYVPKNRQDGFDEKEGGISKEGQELTEYTINDLKNDCMDMYSYFKKKNLEAIIKSVKLSLTHLNERASASRMLSLTQHDKNTHIPTDVKYPLFITDLVLKIPNIIITPSLEDIQVVINKIVQSALSLLQDIHQWGLKRDSTSKVSPGKSEEKIDHHNKQTGDVVQPPKAPKKNIKNYRDEVMENKDVVSQVVTLQSVILRIKPNLGEVLQSYKSFSHLWAENNKDLIKEFVDSSPLPIDIEDKFLEFTKVYNSIQNISAVNILCPLQIETKLFALSLLVEWKEIKRILDNHLMIVYRQKLKEMVDFIDEKNEVLLRGIVNLDDARVAMDCLESIRENFIDLDLKLIEIEEVFTLFTKFDVKVPPKDMEQRYELRFNFESLIDSAKEVQEMLCQCQEPMKIELLKGVADFNQEVIDFDNDFKERGPMEEGLEAREASDRVLLFQARFDELWRKFEVYSSGEKLFGMVVNEYPILIERKKQFNLLQKLYGLYLLVNQAIDGYFEMVWSEVDIEAIMAELTDFQNRCRKLPKGMKDWPAFIELKKKIDDFNATCPLLEMMANKAMKDRHWTRLEKLTGCPFDVESDKFTLKHVMEAPLLKFQDDVEDICLSAIKEKDIEAKLKQVILDWQLVNLEFSFFKNRGELLLKGSETSEIIALLEDSLMVMNSLLSNRYNAPFKKEIQLWVWKLSTTGEILENWLMVQNLWIYLEAVFVGGDIAMELPTEAKRFANIDKSWVKIMNRARQLVNVIDVCVGDETMGQLLPHLLEQLESCQKSLTGYLEQKRLIFPRFFFVSDPALLEILGQASDSHSIQNHLTSVFENISKVEFSEKEYDKIISICSREDEIIGLEKEIMCIGGVEHWLGGLLNQAKLSLGGVITNVYEFMNEPDFTMLEMVAKFPAQVGLLGLQMLWTRDSEFAMTNFKYDKTIMRTTNDYFLNLLNQLIEQTTLDLSKFERIKYETLVTIHVHQRDIFDDLCRMRIRSTEDFEWLKQERFYFNYETDECKVSITDVDFIYQNEFLGCTDRLVITPLTDRCYITLAQAIGMSMGGAPAGPAGTGKTETTKDMGKSLGKYVVVFNCSDQMDFRGLGRIYKGLAQSGSWGCFDEFNRIELPVLSVAAQQISIVLSARKEHKTSFLFSDGDIVSLNPEFGIFITMNPGYAGRQELPENLKIMFRSVAMMVPDRQIIMRVKLAACGFKDNIILARKFFTLYKLCEEQLSKQVHYDFGLRNILSVLRTLGAQKRANPSDTEDTCVMRVLRDMNVSKLVDEDEPLFISLIEDLFVGLKLTTFVYKDIQKAIVNVCNEMVLVNHPPWNLKIIQLYETSLVRHGLMTLGPTGAGKTKCIHALMKALTECGRPHKEMRMNPKAITASQMFGRLDAATNDWTDGIFSTLWRRTLKVKKSDNVWLVLDGPVDAVWIENLNSVLDDNKTLTLANGDRIVMAPNAKLLFEPDNVDNASPATVSRMGMVFMSGSVLTWPPILEGWLKTRPVHEANIFRNLSLMIYTDLNVFLLTKLVAKMNILEALYIRQCIDILCGLLNTETDHPAVTNPSHLEKLFLFSVMWSLGAVLELDGRNKLEQFILEHPSKLNWPKLKDGSDTIFEYVVGESGEWQHWSERVEEYYYPSDSVPEYASILVPNVDNIRTAFLIDTISKQSKGVLLIGEQGTAKTVMIKSYMNNYDPEVHLNKSFNFSSATTPNMFQRIIESYVDKRVGTTFGPPNNRKMTIFIDDINMPVVNEWGDQVTNEVVRQLMEMSGFYSLDKPGDFCTIADIQFLAAMIHPGGGRNDIPPRLKRRFCIFNCTIPSEKSMDKIFSVLGEGYFCESRFKDEIVEFLPRLIPLTRLVWQQTKVKMLPTPAKFHYIFNLRDLSRIWEGMLTIKDEECTNITVLLKLWKHECLRVIADRFTNDTDQDWFVNNLIQTTQNYLEGDAQLFDPSETYFVDFLREMPDPTGDEPDDFVLEAPKIYEEIPSWDFLKEKLLMYMAGYNEIVRGAKMDMVFFLDAMIHLMKISRIIRTPRGNALLVGVGGSGKQSLTRLATYIANYKSHQITLTRSYNAGNLMEDLKHIYRVAGVEGIGISFIFTDNEIKEESFLEYLNNVLSTGEVANLFAKDELDEITNNLIPIMKKIQPRRPPTQDNLYDFFISRARNNIHVVLCFSPVGEKFRSRALKFPGLISGCTMDWFSRWPKDALIAVSNHFLRNFPIVCSPQVKEEIIYIMGEVQDGVADICQKYFERYRRQSHVTPKSFLSFLDGYKSIYSKRLNNINILAEQMNVGLEKLVEAAASVDILRKDLEEKEKDIIEATEKADVVLSEVTKVAQAAEAVKAEVKEVADRATEIVESIAVDKAVAVGKLEAARPALEEAEAALQTIKAADIATVRKLGKPPYLITLIMDVVLILFQRKVELVRPEIDKNFFSPNWAESLKVMADTRFLFNLQNFPKDNINGETVDLMKPYLNYSGYTYEAAKTACGNVAGLISWTIAMKDFYEVNKEVLPLKANLAVQQNKLNMATKELNEASKILEAKEKELEAAQVEFNSAMDSKLKVLEIANKLKAKMDAASALINGLSDEQVRWTEQSHAFKSEIERLVGDVLLLTGFLSYSGPFNQEFRNLLQSNWYDDLVSRKIPVTQNLNITENLIDAATIGEWNLQGLPNDELSIQNGIIVTKAPRYPLLIDPQSQGIIWIKNKEQEFNLQVTSLNHKYFRNHIEDCLSLGRPLLIEDVLEELDPALDQILEKNFIKVGNTLKVKVGDKEMDVNTDFRLYITTKLPNPLYTPEISARTSIIDFTVTMKGLEDQLLGRVILTEKKELETERTNLIQEVTGNKRLMKELESNLLYKLTTVEGSLVEDESVIAVLNKTKDTAADVKQKLKIAAATEIKINAAREEFRPVATRGSVLYFLIVEMSMVNYMYQTSLVQFLERFDLSMARSEKSLIASKRITFIIEYLTFEVFKYKCRGLYENHKYLFTLLLTLKIDIQRNNVSHEEFQNFIKGGAALDLNACPPKPSKWITDLVWLNLVQLSSLPHFKFILTQVPQSEKQWKIWYDKPAPEDEPMPDGYETLDPFRRLLMVRAWCPDRTLSQSKKYVSFSMDSRYAEPVILNIDVLLTESRPLTPMVGLLSMGSDPTPLIETAAKRREIECTAISMGQGQEIHARKWVALFMSQGGWVLLQNCHLGLEYMSELFTVLTEADNVHPEFRLWITTEPHERFPISLLQISLKFTNEPPQGVRAGLKRTYGSMSQDMLDYSAATQYLPMIYAVSFLHTVVQERRKFGPLGWNIPYEFNFADWYASCMFVQNHLDDMDPKAGVSWNTVRYMLGEVQYGGRVTDDFDKRLLVTFAKVWFSEAMFSDAFNFYTGYKIIVHRNLNEYMEAIDEMSPSDPPQAYGLHPNADISYQSSTTTSLLETIVSIQPKEAGSGGGESRESVVTRLTEEMLSKLPKDYDPFEVKERLKKMGILNSMNIFLRQEIDRMQVVISLVRKTLKDLLLAVEGSIIMNEALRDSLDNIYDARIPTVWKRGSWASSSLGFWFTELLERNIQFSNWIFIKRPPKFWMTGFFNPQGFLTAMRQEVARAHKGWPLDSVTLHNEVTKFTKEDVKTPPSEGVYVYGLYLDGAGWDRKNCRLTESVPKVLSILMPVVHIFAIYSTAPKDPKLYLCPVYKKPNRTDLTFITPLWLQCKFTPEHWILRGVALLCDNK